MSKSISKSSKGENVKVVVRCRPLNSGERERNEKQIVTMDPKLGSVRVCKPDSESEFKVFTFDSVYPPGTEQKHIFTETAKPIIDSVMGGYNGTLFCYGQTGTGKTFTMEGVVDDKNLMGLMPQSFYYIFESVTGFGKNTEFLVRASFLEIYKDDVYDLLNAKTRQRMEVKESEDKGVFVKDLSTFTVKDPEGLLKVLKAGQKQRKVGATKMNEGSSRSHSILTVTIESSETDEKGNVHYKVGKLNMVDLAGSERQKKTEATGDRLDEAKSINWSLTVLGNCIKALVEPNSKHVPYRDSKLTRLLQDSLGGNTKTVMCANLGPAALNFEETISTLRYADRAKQIKNKPTINEDPKDTMLREMQDEIAKLKAMLAARKNGGVMPAGMNFEALGIPHSTEGEHIYDVTQIEGDTIIEEKIVEKVVDRHTGISEDDLEKLAHQVQQEHDRVERELIAQNMEASEAKAMAERAAQQYEEELKRKAELLAQEQAQIAALAKALEERGNQLTRGAQALDKAQKAKLDLKKTEDELRIRREQQEKLKKELAEAEEQELLMTQQYVSAEEELKNKTIKLKKLWSKYQEKKSDLSELQEEFSLERNDLLDTIRSLDRQIKLKNLILEEFIPDTYTHLIESHAHYDPINDQWMIPGVEYAGNNIEREGMSMMWGASHDLNDYDGAHAQQRRNFTRHTQANHINMHMYSNMQQQGINVMGMQQPQTQQRFFNYNQFLQQKEQQQTKKK